MLSYEAPGKRELPAWVAEAARRAASRSRRQAARALVERLGEGTVRLGTELDRIALWAEPGGGSTSMTSRS